MATVPSIPHVFAPLSGNVPVSFIDADFTAVANAFAGVASLTEVALGEWARFSFVDATHCALGTGVVPIFDGTMWSAVTLLTPVPVDNTGLAATTLYYAYAVAGVTVEFSTVAPVMDTATGSLGVMIKTGDKTRTLVGMVFTDASSHFISTVAGQLVRSWRSDPGFRSLVSITATVSPANSLTFAAVSATLNVAFLSWTGEIVTAVAQGAAAKNTAGFASLALGWDGVAAEPGSWIFVPSTGGIHPVSFTSIKPGLTQGIHTVEWVHAETDANTIDVVGAASPAGSSLQVHSARVGLGF